MQGNDVKCISFCELLSRMLKNNVHNTFSFAVESVSLSIAAAFLPFIQSPICTQLLSLHLCALLFVLIPGNES